MGYMHIDNLYKNDAIFLFKRCYAQEGGLEFYREVKRAVSQATVKMFKKTVQKAA